MVLRVALSAAAMAAALGGYGCTSQSKRSDPSLSGHDPRVADDPKKTDKADKTDEQDGSDLMPPAPSPSALTIAARSGAPAALVVLLHGFGADAASFHEIARSLAPSFPDMDFLTPDGFEPSDLGNGGHQWFSLNGLTEANRAERVRESGAAVSSWIDRQLDARRLGHGKLVVIGFSQGSNIAAWLAVHRSPAPIAVVMFSGRVTEDQTPVAHAVSTPVLMAHGANDTRIPVSVLDPGAAMLEAWGAHVTRRVYPGLEHSIDGRELRDATEFLKAALTQK